MNTEQWSRQWATQLAQILQYDDDRRDIVSYGLFIMLHTIMAIVVTGIVGLVCGVFIESLIISFSIAILRKASGGTHATSPGRCLLIGAFVCVGGGLLSELLSQIGTMSIGIIMLIISIWAYVVIGMKAPVDSIAKPIRSLEKRKRLKKSSWSILSLYIVMIVVSFGYGVGANSEQWIVYSLCILLGFTWQVMSLTSVGKWVIQKLDFLLINIVEHINGGKTNEKC